MQARLVGAGVGALRTPMFAVLCVAVFVLGALGALLHDDQRLASGIVLAGEPVGGLTRDAARARLAQALAPQLPPALTLTWRDHVYTMANASIGRRLELDGAVEAAWQLTRQGGLGRRAAARWRLRHGGAELPVAVGVDAARLRARLTRLAALLDDEPENARVAAYRNGVIEAAPARDGVRLDVAETAKQAVGNGYLPAPSTVTLVVRVTPARVGVIDLQRDLNTVLARYTTNMAAHYVSPMRENRRHNVDLCLARMRGIVVGPGETFSFNGVIGERRAGDGFRKSVIFKRQPDGTIEEEWEIGGGICQLASTLFNAALLANMAVTERNNHSKVVAYVPIGRDAMVYYGGSDLKFTNSLRRPVMIWGELRGWDLVLTFVGDGADRSDVALANGSARQPNGTVGWCYRTVRMLDGTVLKDREPLFRSFYPAEPKPAPAKTEPAAARAPSPAKASPAPAPAAAPPEAEEAKM